MEAKSLFQNASTINCCKLVICDSFTGVVVTITIPLNDAQTAANGSVKQWSILSSPQTSRYWWMKRVFWNSYFRIMHLLWSQGVKCRPRYIYFLWANGLFGRRTTTLVVQSKSENRKKISFSDQKEIYKFAHKTEKLTRLNFSHTKWCMKKNLE